MDTNLVSGWVGQAEQWVKQLYALPYPLLAGLSCIVVGYILKRLSWFHNENIPVVVVLWGAFCNSMLSPGHPTGTSTFKWHALNAIVGVVVGFAAWGFHYYLLNKLEDKFPWLGKLLSGTVATSSPTPAAPVTKPGP